MILRSYSRSPLLHSLVYICSSVTPVQWASFSNENILKTERECNSSATLRGVIDTVLDQTQQDIERQRAAVNLAFEKRIQETTEAKESLEQHLEKVVLSVPSHTLWSHCYVHFECFLQP